MAATNGNGERAGTALLLESLVDDAQRLSDEEFELRHGGATAPPRSYTVPSGFPLQPATTYHWRVRPRVQGDGTPVAWSEVFTFVTQGGSAPPASPAPSPVPSPAPSPPAASPAPSPPPQDYTY